jgi:hypothetical protein
VVRKHGGSDSASSNGNNNGVPSKGASRAGQWQD